MAQIFFNGKSYSSLDEMPASERAQYDQIMSVFTDADKNGIPDIFEGDIIKNVIKLASTNIVVNGQQVQSLESLPPEARQKIEQAMAKMSSMGLLPRSTPGSAQNEQPTWDKAAIHASAPLLQSEPVHSEVGGSRGLLIALAAGLLLVCAAASLYYFFVAR